jgi:hypothetical protein
MRTSVAISPGTAVAAHGAVGTEPPTNAIVLFDGSDLRAWTGEAGDEAPAWPTSGGHVTVAAGSGDLVSRRSFSDFQLHLEFWLPHMPEATGQDRANSGIFLQGRYELQILDSFAMEPTDDGCGAIYGAVPPLWNACRRPEVWQVLDLAFTCCCPDLGGGIRRRPHVTAFLNGVLIHNNVAIPAPTPGALDEEETEPGPLRLQDHGCAVRYRNIWIVPAGRRG